MIAATKARWARVRAAKAQQERAARKAARKKNLDGSGFMPIGKGDLSVHNISRKRAKQVEPLL
jgi:hypothetical protein